MKASTKRILSIGLAGILFIGTLFVYSTFIRPELKAVDTLSSETASREFLFRAEQNAVQKVRDLIGKLQGAAQLRETLSLALPNDDNVPEALNEIQTIIRLSGVVPQTLTATPTTFRPSAVPLVKRLGVLDINLSVAGSYPSIKSFLNALETNVRITTIESFTVNQISGFEGGAGDTYALSIKAEMYYQE